MLLYIYIVGADAFSTNILVAKSKRFASTIHSSHRQSHGDRGQRRRQVLSTILGITSSTIIVQSYPSYAGEVGARITKAVTTSDLGISVRTSVVKGAQVMDQIDGKWEGLSDRFGLGSERSKQAARPAPKEIPPPLPLDSSTAKAILTAADDVYLSLMPYIKMGTLQDQINKVVSLVKPSFERSGIILDENIRDVKTADDFNFASYVHFKAYSDIIISEQGKSFDFNGFRRNFEAQFGQRLVSLLLPRASNAVTLSGQRSEQILASKLRLVDQLFDVLKDKGLLSLTERSPLDKDQITDWLDNTSDLTFTIAIDGDITLGSQMLLQEQGFRLYPDYPRFGVLSLLRGIEGQDLQIDDYYFDTDYNSDPDKFEVKEVVLNISLDSV